MARNGAQRAGQSSSVQGESVEAAADDRYLVPALIRGLDILKTLSNGRARQSLTDVSSSLGVTRSSAYRLLFTLNHLGLVEFDAETKTYALGPQVLSLGYGYLQARDIVEVAMPHLVRLRDRTGWSAHLGELSGRDVLYLSRVATRRSIASTVHVGTRLPARVTTMGRVLLAGLADDELRDLFHGEALGAGGVAGLLRQVGEDRARVAVAQNSTYEPGIASVAAPVRDMTDRVIAAINISTVAMLTDEAELNGALRAEVLAAAEAISRDLGRVADAALDPKKHKARL